MFPMHQFVHQSFFVFVRISPQIWSCCELGSSFFIHFCVHTFFFSLSGTVRSRAFSSGYWSNLSLLCLTGSDVWGHSCSVIQPLNQMKLRCWEGHGRTEQDKRDGFTWRFHFYLYVQVVFVLFARLWLTLTRSCQSTLLCAWKESII